MIYIYLRGKLKRNSSTLLISKWYSYIITCNTSDNANRKISGFNIGQLAQKIGIFI